MGRWIIVAAAAVLVSGCWASEREVSLRDEMTNERINTLVERINQLDARIQALEQR